MSMHRIPLTQVERDGLKAHGLAIGKPSQLSDVFRQGIQYALENSDGVYIDRDVYDWICNVVGADSAKGNICKRLMEAK